MLTVICPLYNEEKYIVHCVESILKQDYPKDDLEVLFVDGMSTDNSRAMLQRYCDEHSYFRLLENRHKVVPYAMNLAIREAKGDVILRIDMHAEYAPNYFSTLVSQLMELNADNVGCVWKTDVLNKTAKSLAIKAVLSSRFGVGNGAFRVGSDHVMEVDTVPFGCFRRDVFEKYGYYDERLVRNQDIELNKRIAAGGGKIFLLPEALCTYYARENFCAIARNNYLNGLWNLLVVRMTRNFASLSLRHFVPLLFLLSLIVPLVAAILWCPFAWLSLASLLTYCVAMTCVCFSMKKRDNNLSISHLMRAFVVLHFSYAAGSFMGIFKPVAK